MYSFSSNLRETISSHRWIFFEALFGRRLISGSGIVRRRVWNMNECIWQTWKLVQFLVIAIASVLVFVVVGVGTMTFLFLLLIMIITDTEVLVWEGKENGSCNDDNSWGTRMNISRMYAFDGVGRGGRNDCHLPFSISSNFLKRHQPTLNRNTWPNGNSLNPTHDDSCTLRSSSTRQYCTANQCCSNKHSAVQFSSNRKHNT